MPPNLNMDQTQSRYAANPNQPKQDQLEAESQEMERWGIDVVRQMYNVKLLTRQEVIKQSYFRQSNCD